MYSDYRGGGRGSPVRDPLSGRTKEDRRLAAALRALDARVSPYLIHRMYHVLTIDVRA